MAFNNTTYHNVTLNGVNVNSGKTLTSFSTGLSGYGMVGFCIGELKVGDVIYYTNSYGGSVFDLALMY